MMLKVKPRTMAQALADADEPAVTLEESCIPIPLSELLATKINIASGEDANFTDDQLGSANFTVHADEAWDWHEYEAKVRAMSCTSML